MTELLFLIIGFVIGYLVASEDKPADIIADIIDEGKRLVNKVRGR